MTKISFSEEHKNAIQNAGRVILDKNALTLFLMPVEPCDFKSLAGSDIFTYDPENNAVECKDSDDLARIFISKYEEKKNKGELLAVDLNNIACAYLWQKVPDWKTAAQLFTEAAEKPSGDSTIDSTIKDNKDRAERALHNPNGPVHVPINMAKEPIHVPFHVPIQVTTSLLGDVSTAVQALRPKHDKPEEMDTKGINELLERRGVNFGR